MHCRFRLCKDQHVSFSNEASPIIQRPLKSLPKAVVPWSKYAIPSSKKDPAKYLEDDPIDLEAGQCMWACIIL